MVLVTLSHVTLITAELTLTEGQHTSRPVTHVRDDSPSSQSRPSHLRSSFMAFSLSRVERDVSVSSILFHHTQHPRCRAVTCCRTDEYGMYMQTTLLVQKPSRCCARVHMQLKLHTALPANPA
jgi:hypothetical protein